MLRGVKASQWVLVFCPIMPSVVVLSSISKKMLYYLF